VLAAAREAELALRRYRGLEAAPLRVGGSNVPGNYLIPALLPRLLARLPGLVVTLVVGDSRETLARLAEDEVELAVVGSRFAEERLRCSRVGGERILLAVAPQHRWAARRSVSLAELAGAPMIVREAGSGTGRTVEQALARAGLDPRRLRVAARLGSNEAVKSAVASGLGVSLVSELSCRRELDGGELVAVRVRGLEIARSFYLARRAGCALSPAARAFAAALRAASRARVTGSA
jgi:DNA-binding transcriptional LysR family regulator